MVDKSRKTIRNFLSGIRGSSQPSAQAPMEDPSLMSNRNPSMDSPQLSEEAMLELSRVAPGMYKPVPEVIIFEWMALSRPFKKRNRQFFVTVLVIALLVSLILFFSGQVLPIAMVFSVVFLNYVLSVIPPQEIRHTITTFGVNVEGNLYYWQELGRFWFDTKYGSTLLFIEVARFPGRITLVIPKEKKEAIQEVLTEVLLHQKPPLSTFEKIAQWLQEKFPLE